MSAFSFSKHNTILFDYFEDENISFDRKHNNVRVYPTDVSGKKEAHCTKPVNIESLEHFKSISHRKQAAHETWMCGCAVTLRADTYVHSWNRYSAS